MSTDTDKATARPLASFGRRVFDKATGETVAVVEDEADAPLIVQAVNSHAGLVKASKLAKRAMNLHQMDARGPGGPGERGDAKRAIDAALAKAKP